MAARVELPPLVPSVKRSTFRVHDPDREEADEGYRRVRLSVLQRDRFTCRFCGFVTMPERQRGAGGRASQVDPSSYAASGFLEVHHLNDDHTDNRPDNLVTSCPFCHQVFHCGNAGHRDAANVIFFPWLSQAEVNILANAAACAIANDGMYVHAGRTFFAWLRSTESMVVEHFGESFTSAANLGSVLMTLSHEAPDLYERRGVVLRGIRLLPKPDAFDRHVKHWRENAWQPEKYWEGFHIEYRNEVEQGTA